MKVPALKYIDAFNHFIPARYFEAMASANGHQMTRRVRGIRSIHDLDERFRVMDTFEDYQQILSLAQPPIEAMGTPAEATALARIANDGLAELVDRYPERFPGHSVTLAMSDPDAAARELERCVVENGANGVQIYSHALGKPLDAPEFAVVFEAASELDVPVLLHPARTAAHSDYAAEEKSQYEIWWTLGWPYETSAALARLVFSGMLDRLPNLKVISHHLGGLIPYLEGRVGPGWDQLGVRTADRDLTVVLQNLKRRLLDYFKDFYADTATFGARSAMVCGLDFFRSDRVVFASDSPFDPEGGPGYIRETINILQSLDLPQETLAAIAHGNAERIFRLKPVGASPSK